MLLAALDGTIVGTAMPRVIAELQGFEHYAAVTTTYMLAATAVVPIVGKLSDMYGRKPFLLVGVAVFVVGSALCGAADEHDAADRLPRHPGLRRRHRAGDGVHDHRRPLSAGPARPRDGMMGAVFGLASVIGPAVGGFLTDGPGWRWCFYVNLPIGARRASRCCSSPSRTSCRTRTPNDASTGSAPSRWCSASCRCCWRCRGAGATTRGRSVEVLSLLSGGLVMTAVFLLVQTRTPHAIIPPSLFRNRVVWSASAAAMLMSLGMFGSILFIPLFIQGVVGRSASESGAVMTPMMFALIASSIIAGQVMTRTRPLQGGRRGRRQHHGDRHVPAVAHGSDARRTPRS